MTLVQENTLLLLFLQLQMPQGATFPQLGSIPKLSN